MMVMKFGGAGKEPDLCTRVARLEHRVQQLEEELGGVLSSFKKAKERLVELGETGEPRREYGTVKTWPSKTVEDIKRKPVKKGTDNGDT